MGLNRGISDQWIGKTRGSCTIRGSFRDVAVGSYVELPEAERRNQIKIRNRTGRPWSRAAGCRMPRFLPTRLARRLKPFDHPDSIYEITFDGFRALIP